MKQGNSGRGSSEKVFYCHHYCILIKSNFHQGVPFTFTYNNAQSFISTGTTSRTNAAVILGFVSLNEAIRLFFFFNKRTFVNDNDCSCDNLDLYKHMI